MTDLLLDDLDPRQRDAVTERHVPLAILAPAGSGKTRVLTRRIAFRVRDGTADARHVLALTFTRKAAGELVQRIRRLGVDHRVAAGTFHATALAQLRRRAIERGMEAPTVLDRKSRLLAPLVGGRRAEATIAMSNLAADIEWAKARLVSPEHFTEAARRAHRPLVGPPEEIAELYARYETEKRRRHLVDFDDVLRNCADAIAREPEFRAAQQWRFRHLFVDEFQDATPLQLMLLRAWLGDAADLTVVGDPAQAIYGFAGADATPLARFEQTFPGGRCISLEHNYRSAPAVVSTAEVALGDAAGRARIPPRAVHLDGPVPVVRGYDDDEAEAIAVADACRVEARDGTAWRDMAVLFRTNAQSARFEQAMSRRGVPFRVTDANAFTARPEVRVLLERLQSTQREEPARPFAHLLSELTAPAADDDHDDEERVEVPAEREHRDALLALGRDYLAAEPEAPTLNGFVAWLDVATRTAGSGTDAVELVTFHRAKGLEWRLVFVTGLERGLVPITWATSLDALAEERRLLHVALSRAEADLRCSWAHVRTFGGRRSRREPSPWLGELERHVASLRVVPREPREHVAAARSVLAAAAPPPRVPISQRRARR